MSNWERYYTRKEYLLKEYFRVSAWKEFDGSTYENVYSRQVILTEKKRLLGEMQWIASGYLDTMETQYRHVVFDDLVWIDGEKKKLTGKKNKRGEEI